MLYHNHVELPKPPPILLPLLQDAQPSHNRMLPLFCKVYLMTSGWLPTHRFMRSIVQNNMHEVWSIKLADHCHRTHMHHAGTITIQGNNFPFSFSNAIPSATELACPIEPTFRKSCAFVSPLFSLKKNNSLVALPVVAE